MNEDLHTLRNDENSDKQQGNRGAPYTKRRTVRELGIWKSLSFAGSPERDMGREDGDPGKRS